MNQVKIGKFIAEMRKQQNLTQRQLAEQVGVSDKTVSKWETGRSMPDNGVLMDVCMILHISVNELLSGEKFPEENYVDKAEENMIELVKESEMHRKKGNWSIVGTVIGLVMLVFACLGVIFSWGGVKALAYFIDMPTLFFMIGIPVLVLVASGALRDFFYGFLIVYGKREYGYETIRDAWLAIKMVLYIIPLTGLLICFVSFIVIIGTLNRPEMLGPYIAIAMLAIFYGVIFDIFLMPTAVRLRKKINESNN
ncbi:MAG: helix-turn-helix domain-containing protein [Agathobacter sp.]|nr:helix-turn-helix domain-containing protein [Agathobacter sp.]